MLTGDIAPTLQPSKTGMNLLTLNDGWLNLDQRKKEHFKVSLNAWYRHSDDAYSLPYDQVIFVNSRESGLASSDGAFSGQSFPDRPDPPRVPLPKNGPDSELSAVHPATLSHGCQCLSHLSHKAIPYPTQSIAYEPFIDSQLVGPITVPPFIVRY